MICCSSIISLLLPVRIQLFAWLFFLPLWSIFFGIHVDFVSGECLICREDQLSLLLQLKSTLKFNVAASSNLVSWNPSTDCCSWRGVTWDATGHVVALDLSSQSISGEFNSSSSIFSLQRLQSLNLANNNFSAPVPQLFANFSNLIHLHLSSCGLYGAFPEKIFQSPTLQILDLSNNKLLEGSLPEFPQNGSLETLVLSDTEFSGEVPNSIGNLKRLTRIELARCNFSGPIPKAVANLTQLVYLDFSHNNFSGPIPFFSLSNNLTQINLSHNYLAGQIPSSHWDGLVSLVTIDLSGNNLTGQIPSSLGQLRQLKSLDLSQNKLSGEIPTQLTTLNFLTFLNLSFNQLVGSIPKGNQFQKFSANSFLGNRGLCGFPLNASCEDATPPTFDDRHSGSDPDIDWKYIASELGFVTGLGIVYWPLVLCKRWRKCYFKHVDRILSRILHKQDQGRASGGSRSNRIQRRRM